MKLLTLFYIILYALHIFLGPYFLWDLLYNKKLKWVSKSWEEVGKRCFWITYVTFLLIALFNEYPSTETFILALILSLCSTIGYGIKFRESEYIKIGLMDHFLFLLIPVFYLFINYKINITSYNPSYLSYMVFLYLAIFVFIDQHLYKTGFNL